jgi:phosphatidylinositol dimannoside acyltransferase
MGDAGAGSPTGGSIPPEGMDWRSAAKYVTYRGLATAMGRLPEPLARGAADSVARVLARRGGPALSMNERHLRRVLQSEGAGVVPDPALVRRWSRRTYREYARYWVDGARLPYTSGDEIRARVMFERGEDHLRSAARSGQGVVLALPHVGSWEWGGAWLALEDMPMTAVVERLSPPQLFNWFLAQRAEMGLTGVPLGDGSGAVVLRTLRQGGVIGLVCDRDLVGNGVEVEFFGEKTTLPGGAATLALRTGAALIPAAVYSGPGSWHTCVVGPPLNCARTGSMRADVSRLTQELAGIFEGYIRRRPEQWHLYQPNWPSDRA